MDDTIFVDTNVFLRFFVNDVLAQYERARSLFVFAKKEVTEVLTTLLSSRKLRIAGHGRIREAVRLYAAGNMDFIDVYNIAYVRSKDYSKVATFDHKHFSKVEGISIV